METRFFFLFSFCGLLTGFINFARLDQVQSTGEPTVIMEMIKFRIFWLENLPCWHEKVNIFECIFMLWDVCMCLSDKYRDETIPKNYTYLRYL